MKTVFILITSFFILVGCSERNERLDCVEQFLREDNGMPKSLNRLMTLVSHENDEGFEEYLDYLQNCWDMLEYEGIKIELPDYDLSEAFWGKLSTSEREAIKEQFLEESNE